MADKTDDEAEALNARAKVARDRTVEAMLHAGHQAAGALHDQGYTTNETLDAAINARIVILATIATTFCKFSNKPMEQVRGEIVEDLDDILKTMGWIVSPAPASPFTDEQNAAIENYARHSAYQLNSVRMQVRPLFQAQTGLPGELGPEATLRSDAILSAANIRAIALDRGEAIEAARAHFIACVDRYLDELTACPDPDEAEIELARAKPAGEA